MSRIRFACPQCGRGIAAPEHAAGCRAHCPACKHPLDVRQLEPPPGPAAGAVPPAFPPKLPRSAHAGAVSDVAYPKCGVRLGVPERVSVKPVHCGACDYDFDLSSSPPPPHPPTPSRRRWASPCSTANSAGSRLPSWIREIQVETSVCGAFGDNTKFLKRLVNTI